MTDLSRPSRSRGQVSPKTAVALLVAAGFLSRPLPLRAQTVEWKNEFVFYGDNTEFTHFFRVGETILGAQFQTDLDVHVGSPSEVRVGVFGDHRSGGDRFLDPVKPILSFRYRTGSSMFVLGTLETRDRHGYLEPLEVTTLEFTRPIEYGLQWLESRPRFHADLYLNWQHLNTSTSREIFDYGGVLRGDLLDWAALEGQLHGLHHGGQLFDVGVGPVTNNIVYGPGLRLHRNLPIAGESTLAGFYLASKGKPDPFVDTPTISGHGTYLRGSISPGNLLELFAIEWWGKDFVTNEGDHNYGSPGLNGAFYQSRRRYAEFGAIKKVWIEKSVQLDAELRLHRIESKVEYSYRLVVRVPFEFVVKR